MSGVVQSIEGRTAGITAHGVLIQQASSVAARVMAAPLMLIVALAAAVTGGIDAWQKFAWLSQDYGDLDDALRMVQVRELMTGQPWFDTTLARMGGTEPLLSHWSRLIDLPLALLIAFFSLFASASTAELVVRLLWPTLLLAVLFYTVTRAVDLTAGRMCSLIALALLLMCPSATSQFSVGRIDHHNVQNWAAAGSILLLWLVGRVPNAGRWAGVIAGIGVAVGYEALPVILLATAAASVWGLLDRQAAGDVRAYVLSLTGTLFVAFLVTTPTSRWLVQSCDALSLNLIGLIGCGAAGVVLALGPGQMLCTRRRWMIVIAAGLVGAVGFAWAEPLCLGGPMGQTPAALKGVWLEHVPEARGWLYFLSTEPYGAIPVAVLFVLAFAALLVRIRIERRAADIFYAVVFLLTLPLAFWQMKYLPYSSALAIAPLAVVIGRLPAFGTVSATTVRLVAGFICSQYVLMLLTAMVTPESSRAEPVAPPAAGAAQGATGPEACQRREHLRALDAVAPGLMFAPIDFGSHLLADTHHRVLAGAYHRVGPQILATHAVLSERDPAAAATALQKIGADYVLICPAIGKLLTPIAGHPDTLDARLRRGERLAFLEPVVLPEGSPFRLWRRVGTAGPSYVAPSR